MKTLYSGGEIEMRIAIVDDEQLIVDGLIKIIGRQYPQEELQGYTSPTEAAQFLGDSLPDLLITDIRMPDMTGLELIAALKQRGLRHCAVLTGLEDVPLLQESIRLHVDDYLIKPVNKAELFAMIDRVREEIRAARAQEKNALAGHFAAADISDGELIAQLVSQLGRSECPPEQLAGFLAEIGREAPYWDICRLTHDLLAEEAPREEMASVLRALPQVRSSSSEVIQQVCQRLREGYMENITVAGMAAEVYLQPNYLTTLFRKETGTGFVQYLNQIRIEQGCRLLLTEPNLTMTAIAPRCGFPSDRYFFSTFKRFTGRTPGEFREDLAAWGFIRS